MDDTRYEILVSLVRFHPGRATTEHCSRNANLHRLALSFLESTVLVSASLSISRLPATRQKELEGENMLLKYAKLLCRLTKP